MNKFEKGTLSVVFSNLAKAAEKQQNYEEADEFGRMAESCDAAVSEQGGRSELSDMIAADLEQSYPIIQKEAEAAGDRGVQRALRWGSKVTAIHKSLIDRYESKGDELFEEKGLFLCEACGFIFLGDSVPVVCPVCKAPSARFSKI